MKNLIKAIVLTTALLFTVPSVAQIRITLSPPALRTEIVPDRPFDEAVWQPGYYSYNTTTESYDWVPGKWVASPFTGATWIAPHYRVNQEGEYHFVPGHWKRLK